MYRWSNNVILLEGCTIVDDQIPVCKVFHRLEKKGTPSAHMNDLLQIQGILTMQTITQPVFMTRVFMQEVLKNSDNVVCDMLNWVSVNEMTVNSGNF